MTSLQERENAYETEFAHQDELKFKAREKAAKALAAWAAERLGKAGNAAEAYAAEVVAADVTHRKLEETLGQVAEALSPAGIGRAEVDRMLDRLLAQAKAAMRAVKQPRH
jgi:hypothetical protein